MPATKHIDQAAFIKSLEDAGFIIDLTAEQDDIAVRGNALASGDDEQDRAAEDEIINRLNNGDVWAWASVKVSISHPHWPGIEGDDYLGGCSYADEDDFTQPGGYYESMLHEALADWLRSAELTIGRKATKALRAARKLSKA